MEQNDKQDKDRLAQFARQVGTPREQPRTQGQAWKLDGDEMRLAGARVKEINHVRR